MNGYDQPHPLLPPDGNGELSWDPNGPEGKLVAAFDPEGRTLGELMQGEVVPSHGWLLSAEGMVTPDTAEVSRMAPIAAAQGPNAAALLLLLL